MGTKTAAQLELERDDLRLQVTSENMRKAVLLKQNGHSVVEQHSKRFMVR